MITPTDLQVFSLFGALDAATLSDATQRVIERRYRPGEYLFFEGDAPDGLYMLCSGRVRLARTAPDGREQVLAMVAAGETFNALPLFDDQPNPTTARAMSPVQCLLLPRAALLDLIARHPQLSIALLRELSGQVRELMVLVEDLAFRSVRERLARQLLHAAEGGTAELTHQELAERAGTVREIAGRALRQLADEGLVRLERGRVIVLDGDGLRRLIEP